MNPVRRATRDAAEQVLISAVTHAPIRGRRLDVHCVMALTHVQRFEALERVSVFSGRQGIATLPEHVNGTEFGWSLPPDVRSRLVARAEAYRTTPVNRARYLAQLSRHRIGVAPTGYGELGQRHAAVLFAGAVLVCQDLEHVEMMFPLEDRNNAVFCRPDLSDLAAVIRELLADPAERHTIARNGRESILHWARDWRQRLYEGVEQPMRAALGLASS
jgi:hypothetical protein